MYRSFNFTSIGASHIKKGIVCQDFSMSINAADYKLAVISDGHGGADYFRSDRGSRFAAEAFCRCVEKAFGQSGASDEASDNTFLKNKARNFSDALTACRTDKETEEQMRWFVRSVVMHWNELVENDIAKDPFREEEMTDVSDKMKLRYNNGERVQSAYGATLIGVVVTENFWFGVHIGDGKCVAFSKDGEDSEPIPWDDECFLNITTSICDFNASDEFRYYFGRELPAAVFVGSDGIDDSFGNELNMHNFYRVVISSFADESEEKATQSLSDYLPQLSAQGSADDMSVGCILNMDHIRENRGLFEVVKREEEQTADKEENMSDEITLTDEEVSALNEILIKNNEKIRGVYTEYGTMGVGGSNTSGQSCESYNEYSLEQLEKNGAPFKFGDHEICAVVSDIIYLRAVKSGEVIKLIDGGRLFLGDGVAYDTYKYNSIGPLFKE